MSVGVEINAARSRAARRVSDTQERAADVIVQILVEAGVDTVFGIPGGTIAPVFDAFLEEEGISVITSKHECNAVYSAIGFARSTGRLGVAVVTSGPGVLNALTGLASAYCDGVPVLMLAGEVPQTAYGKGALQEGSAYSLNVIGMSKSICKLSCEIPDAFAVPTMLRRAISTANSGRKGPVLLTLPLNVTNSKICVSKVSETSEWQVELREEALDWACKALARSRRKVIFAGSGVRHGEGPQMLRALAERLDCPVMTTPKGKGVFPDDHPLALGVFGIGGHPSAVAHLEKGLETTLAIGTSLGDLATNGYSALLKPSRTLIHVDIDASQVGRTYEAHLSIAAPAELFLDRVLARVEQVTSRSVFGVEHYTEPGLPMMGNEGLISPQRALWELQEILPKDTIYTVDSGEHTLFSLHYLRVVRSDTFIVMTGLGAMGSAVPAALGAKLGQPSRSVVAICGDGGFAMTGHEVSTASLGRVPIIVAVINDRRLGMVEMGHRAHFGRSPKFPVGPLNIPQISEAMGAEAIVIQKPGELLKLESLEALERPLVLDIRIDSSVRLPKNSRFEKLAADLDAASKESP